MSSPRPPSPSNPGPAARAPRGKALPPIERTMVVPAGPAAAFERFTEGIARWWPLRSHSVFGADALRVSFEPRVGGNLIEEARDGRTCAWGTVTRWDPPRRLAFTWHPGRDVAQAQDVEVTFEPCAEGTRVRLVHSGFERLGKLARRARRGYPLGWAYMLRRFADRPAAWMKLLDGVTALATLVRRRPGRRS